MSFLASQPNSNKNDLLCPHNWIHLIAKVYLQKLYNTFWCGSYEHVCGIVSFIVKHPVDVLNFWLGFVVSWRKFPFLKNETILNGRGKCITIFKIIFVFFLKNIRSWSNGVSIIIKINRYSINYCCWQF